MKSLLVKGLKVSMYVENDDEYLSLTDIAQVKGGKSRAADIIKNWIRTRTTLEFIGEWEKLHNPNFKVVEFDHFKMESGLHSFVLSPGSWVEKTSAIGFYVKSGRFGGTFAHKDIAFEFCSSLNPVFKLYLIKEFQRLKRDEALKNDSNWNLQRTIAKINYRIHTDAIKEKLIPPLLTKEQASLIYASEADLLNVALFGIKAKDWKMENSDKKGNIRDYATIEQLVILSNLESINALFLAHNMPPSERLIQLNFVAITQMKSLLSFDLDKKLEKFKATQAKDNMLNLPPIENR